jgi:hypothetical protein
MTQNPKEILRKVGRAIVQVGRVVTGRQIAGRNVTVFPDDVFLTSYPRSGNTWLRFLIGNLAYQDEPVSFANIEGRIPEIHFHSDHRLRTLPRPRLLKSHECFQPHYPRIIYIVRDPRDVAVSFYHHNVKAGNISDDYPMEDFTARFIAAEFDPRWGSWSDHVVSWLTLRRARPGFILLRYEDVKSDPARELARLAAFLQNSGFGNIESAPEKLQRAIDLSSPERMRELEKKQAHGWVLTRNTRPDKPFVRTATSGAWKSTLSPSSVALIESAWGSVMQELGYDVVSGKRD